MDQSGERALENGDAYKYRIAQDGRAVLERCLSASARLAVPGTIGEAVVAHIADSCFARLFNIESVDVPEGVETIGPRAFRSCPNLREVKLPSTLKSVGEEAFFATAIERLVIPASCEDVHETSFTTRSARQTSLSSIRKSPLEEIRVEEGNRSLSLVGGLLCMKTPHGVEAIVCPTSCREAVLEAPVKSVSVNAFSGVSHVPFITLSDSIRKAGRGLVFPDTSCDILKVKCARGEDLVLRMPSREVARAALASLLEGSSVDPGKAARSFDEALAALPDDLKRYEAMLDRVSSGAYLSEASREDFSDALKAVSDSMCLHFGMVGDYAGFDRLMGSGIIDKDSVTHAVDVLTRFGDAAAAAYLLHAKRAFFGEVTWDYGL